MTCKRLLYRCLVALLAALPAAAQQEGPAAAPGAAPETVGDPSPRAPSQETAAPPPATPQARTDQDLRVIRVVSRNPRFPNRAALGDEVILHVKGIFSLLNYNSEARCADLVLFLDGIAIQGSPPVSCSPAEGKVRFRLDRTEKSDRAWNNLLSKPIGFTKTVSISLGSDAEIAYPTEARDFELEVVPRTALFCYLGILAISLILLVYLARKTSLLRATGPVPKGRQAPFSLSRFQLAFWSMLVVAAYLFIWMLTNELDTITGSVLVLLGIGSGTALGAAWIGSSKPTSPPSTPPANREEIPAVPRCSKGFLNDLLSDDHGISIYRFQLFVWTLVLGLIFCASVYDGLQMPQFSTTLLSLMGLSSGTYLGLKVPEGKVIQ